jgi:hypothetical protein
MRTGEIYKWETDKATGYDRRDKYHIYICESDWTAENTFLFVSSTNNGGDYEVRNHPYTCFPKPFSFVSTSSIVEYTDNELAGLNLSPLHCLSDQHLRELHDAIRDSFVMERRQITRLCNAIRASLIRK